MPKEKVLHLITDLHEKFADSEPSIQQQALLDQLNSHVHDMDAEEPTDPDLLDTVEALLNEVKAEHPNVAGALKQVLDILKNIGV